MSRPTVVTVKELSKSFGPREVLKDLSFWIYEGAKIGIIGRNGEGKSTFARILGGLEEPSSGSIEIRSGKKVGMLEQEPELHGKTVDECLELAVAPIRDLLNKYNETSARLAEDLDADAMQKAMDDLERLQNEIENKDAWELDRHLDVAAEALRLPPRDAEVSRLSGGEARRVSLCQVLLQHPDILVLDEPTNHLDAESVEWLEKFLLEYSGTCVMITHDRYFLDNVAEWMVELDRGHLRIFEGNYSTYLEQKATLIELEQRSQNNLSKRLKSELEWIRSTPKARATKSHARLKRYDELVERQNSYEEARGSAVIRLPSGERLGDKVVHIDRLKKSFGDLALFEDLSFELPRAGIVGITGANGLGKTTMIKMMLGEEQADSGSIEVGDTVKFCYVDQRRTTLNNDRTVYEEISDGKDWIEIGNSRMAMRKYCAQFLFTGAVQQVPVGKLSGGERNRLQLAKMLQEGGNVIVLDEPTNDLDLDTLRVLEESLLEFPGTAVVITHDRYFLNRIASHILHFEGDGKVTWFEGNWELYRQERENSSGAGERKRSLHRKLSR